MSLSPNTTLGHYTIISKIGAGGMGEVYRARDTRLDREVAIKVLIAEVSSDSDRLKRFEQEVRATSALNHPNILTVYDIGMNNGSPYIVAELLEGEELRQRLDEGPIALRQTIHYAHQIISGLSAAHEKGIVHRDLKPENLFITKERVSAATTIAVAMKRIFDVILRPPINCRLATTMRSPKLPDHRWRFAESCRPVEYRDPTHSLGVDVIRTVTNAPRRQWFDKHPDLLPQRLSVESDRQEMPRVYSRARQEVLVAQRSRCPERRLELTEPRGLRRVRG